MTYSMYLCVAMATYGHTEFAEESPADMELEDALKLVLQRVLQSIKHFRSKPVSPQATFDLEHQMQLDLRELGRVGVEWALNHVEPSQTGALPPHVEFEAGPYTRLKRKT